jgi:fatty acid desaturase
MNRYDASSVRRDRVFIRQSLLQHESAWRLPTARIWRSLSDIIFDWAMIIGVTWVVYRVGWTLGLFAFVIVGNRQRALGNLLHEASHRNLSTHPWVNDGIAHLLLAPPLLNSLPVYRNLHAHHHAWLGHPQRDPDFLEPIRRKGDHWYHAFIRCLITPSAIVSVLMGHLSNQSTTRWQRLAILSWWLAVGISLELLRGRFALTFIALWFGSRITVFHAITTFREMTDHYGLEPNGVFRFTREIPDRGLLSWLLHPHHNGYHLTHHLFPSTPYHQLPQLHAQLTKHHEYWTRAIICSAYFGGSSSSVAGWGANHA